MTCGRFYEAEIEYARICAENNVRFLFVRSKFDEDLQNAARTAGSVVNVNMALFTRSVCSKLNDTFQEQIDCIELLEKEAVPLFFICGNRSDLFHFPKLLSSIERLMTNADALDSLNVEDWNLSYVPIIFTSANYCSTSPEDSGI